MATHRVAGRRRGGRAIAARDDVDPLAAPLGISSWINFRYAAAEIVADGDRARFKLRQARFEDGRLTIEGFDGDVDWPLAQRLQADARRLFEAQLALWWKSLASILPAWGPPRERD